MIRSTSQFEGATAMATDGEAGSVNDVLFDDERWTVRYLVVKSGGWLNSRKVLVSPMAVNGVDWANRTLGLDLTREQIRNGPDIDWTIRFVVVDTRNWWPGKKVLVSPDRVQHVSWEERRIVLSITRPEVEGSPEFDVSDLGPGMALGGLYRAGNLPPF